MPAAIQLAQTGVLATLSRAVLLSCRQAVRGLASGQLTQAASQSAGASATGLTPEPRQEEAMQVAHRLNIRKYEEGLINAIELHASANRLMQARSAKLNARLKYNLKKRLVNYYKGEPFISE